MLDGTSFLFLLLADFLLRTLRDELWKVETNETPCFTAKNGYAFSFFFFVIHKSGQLVCTVSCISI